MTERIFVSYSDRDQARVQEIVALLRARGDSVWIAYESNRPGEPWATSVAEAIKASDVVLVVISARSAASKDVENEVALAAKENKKLLPVWLEETEPTPWMEYHLSKLHWLDFSASGSQLESALEAAA